MAPFNSNEATIMCRILWIFAVLSGTHISMAAPQLPMGQDDIGSDVSAHTQSASKLDVPEQDDVGADVLAHSMSASKPGPSRGGNSVSGYFDPDSTFISCVQACSRQGDESMNHLYFCHRSCINDPYSYQKDDGNRNDDKHDNDDDHNTGGAQHQNNHDVSNGASGNAAGTSGSAHHHNDHHHNGNESNTIDNSTTSSAPTIAITTTDNKTDNVTINAISKSATHQAALTRIGHIQSQTHETESNLHDEILDDDMTPIA